MSIFIRTGGSKIAIEAKALKPFDSMGCGKLVKNNGEEFTALTESFDN